MKKTTRKTKSKASSRTQARKPAKKVTAPKKASTLKKTKKVVARKSSSVAKKARATSQKKRLGAVKRASTKKSAVTNQPIAASEHTANQLMKGIQAPRPDQQEVSHHVRDISTEAGISPVRESARAAAAVVRTRGHTGSRHH